MQCGSLSRFQIRVRYEADRKLGRCLGHRPEGRWIIEKHKSFIIAIVKLPHLALWMWEISCDLPPSNASSEAQMVPVSVGDTVRRWAGWPGTSGVRDARAERWRLAVARATVPLMYVHRMRVGLLET
jgi:hypothetical protein